jgi:hypothetical protein
MATPLVSPYSYNPRGLDGTPSFRMRRRLFQFSFAIFRRCNLSTRLASPLLLVRSKLLHYLLDLRPEISAYKALLPYNVATLPAVPLHDINGIRCSRLLHHHTHRILETDGAVWRIRRQQEDRAFVDGDILKCRWRRRCVYRLEQHRTPVLVEELWRGVDVVVCSCVGPANDHDGVTGCCRGRGVVYAVIVDWWLEKMGVGLKPEVIPVSIFC